MDSSELAELYRLIDQILPDERVEHDVRACLAENEYTIELEEESIVIDPDVPVERVSKSVIHPYVEFPFGPVRAAVAIGGVASTEHNVIEAVHCFAIAYYTEDGRLISMDFVDRL